MTNDLPRTAAEVGLSNKIVHEARKVRDAERDSPGIIHRTVAERLSAGVAPTHADIRRAITPRPTVAATPNTFAPATPQPEEAVDDGDENYDHYCAFCCADKETVVAATAVYENFPDYDEGWALPRICEDCARKAIEIIEWRRAAAEDAPAPPSSCDFCGKASSEVEKLFRASNAAQICNECVGRCVEIIERRAGNNDPHRHRIPRHRAAHGDRRPGGAARVLRPRWTSDGARDHRHQRLDHDLRQRRQGIGPHIDQRQPDDDLWRGWTPHRHRTGQATMMRPPAGAGADRWDRQRLADDPHMLHALMARTHFQGEDAGSIRPMRTRKRKPTLASVIRAMKRAGVEIAGVEVRDGAVKVISGAPSEATTTDANEWDGFLQ